MNLWTPRSRMTEEEKKWSDHPEQVRWRRGFYGGLQVGVTGGMLIIWLVVFVAARCAL